ncbi:sporulation protein YpjB [Evansella vedderi]|uniref:Sporulation protein YpjB n=1 Tax=Evansella vedderi TaxID=38282 RepID=A0ABU0A529_9BACI|nr:sporulation protein YpjB [Evansella vedderi]MDQ0257455.1 sporulation protein YpjB [Evansella vedderi]
MAERLIKIIVVLSILIVWPFQIGYAEEVQRNDNIWRELNQTSDTILRYVREGHYEEAKKLLNYFSEQFLTIRASEHHLSMRELQVITSVYDEVTKAVTSVSLSHEDRVQKASKLRLLVDVYDDNHKDLWLNTRNTLINPIKNMRKAAEEGNSQRFQDEIFTFVKNYEMVRPAWAVRLPVETYQKVDSQVQYLQQLRGKPLNDPAISEHLNLLETQLNFIYDGKEEESSDPSLIWVMLTIGGAIVLALTYAGWKKYWGEKEKERELRRKKRRAP